MKASELIALLQTIDPDSVVEIYEPECERWAPVSGMVHDRATKETQLYADEEQETDYDDEWSDNDE